MKTLQINPDILLYREDINYLDPENEFCLYDHNQRNEVKIVQIIDHHEFSPTKTTPTVKDRIIYPVGSGLTLLYYI